MNYLQLAQDLSLEADIAGGNTVPGAVTSQAGELARLVTWIKDAYIEIQNRHGHGWRWKKREFEITTVASDDLYAFGDAQVKDVTGGQAAATITAFDSWHVTDPLDPARIFLTSAAIGTQNWMIQTSWEWFRQIYKIGTQNDAYPAHITVDPQNNIRIGPKPNGIYTINGHFYEGAQILAANSDTPSMPVQYHKWIVYRALFKYGMFESDQDVMERALIEGKRLQRQAETNQLAVVRKRGAMA